YGSPRHWREIFDANRDTLEAEDRLVVGKKIRIPKIAAAPAPKAPEIAPLTPPIELAGKKTHVVKAGDSLSTISKLYFKESRFWEKIAEANSKFLKDPHDLKVGMVLVIPEIEAAPAVKAPEAAPTVAPTAPAPELGGKKVHVVGEGDSLSTISQKHFGTTKHWKAIFEANRGILSSPDALSVGMKLVIPEIAAAPAPAAGAPSAPRAPSVPTELAALGTPYTVQEGDTLTSIAEKFLGSQNEWSRISALNVGITMKDADHLSVGMVIVIPKGAEKPVPAPPKPPVLSPAPKSPGLERIDSAPSMSKKEPEPPKKDGAGSSTGSKLGIE
ncbi:MAG: LysM peptidoglycan-binding domain-containing protein, partial [Planctomycetota bacterium]